MGSQVGFLYNDAYAVIQREAPKAMGSRFEAIGEIWSEVGPLAHRAFAGANAGRDLPLTN